MRLVVCLMLLVAMSCYFGWSKVCKERAARVCDLFDCSECMFGCDVSSQHWKVHCIGYYSLPGDIRPWQVEGKLICPACVPWTYSESNQGRIERLEVQFQMGCITCAIRGKLPVGHVCECDLVGAPLSPPIMDPKVVTLSITYKNPVKITLAAYDPDGDLLGINWTRPRYGQLKGEPWLIAIPTYKLSFDLDYVPPGDCWTGRDSFEAWAYDAKGHTVGQIIIIDVENRPPLFNT